MYPQGVANSSISEGVKLYNVLNRIPAIFDQTEFRIIPGNHDCEGNLSSLKQLLRAKQNWKSHDRFYGESTFTSESGVKLRLVSLETCSLVCGIATSDSTSLVDHRCAGGMSKYGRETEFAKLKEEQLKWLQTVRPAAPNEWLIVMGHWPIFSFRGNGPSRTLQKSVLPWMRRAKVDLYLSGHDHALQLIETNVPGDPKFVVSGAGGYALHADLQKDADEAANFGTRLINAQDAEGFVALDVDRESLNVRFHNAPWGGVETFRYKMTK